LQGKYQERRQLGNKKSCKASTMSDPEADRNKAMAAVRAMFEKYHVLAARRPKNHIVSKCEYAVD
jgi:hypothetical protein